MLQIRKNLYSIKAGLIAVLVAFGIIGVFVKTTAAQGASGQGLEISPPVITLTANPGQVVKTNVLIRDVSSTSLLVTGTSNDFVAAGEDGTPKVLLNPDETSPYSMKDWIAVPNSITLVPHEIKTMNITISVPANASPGGHYGVIRFTGTPPNLSGQGVSLNASLGTLVLMTVSGNITEKLSIAGFSVSKNGKSGSIFQSTPINLEELLQNSGNVHERPGGAVNIKNMFGKSITTLPYNPEARYVLPSSTRKFTQTLDKTTLGNKRLFGRYTAVLTVTYGNNNDKTAISKLTFWVIPWKLVLGLIAAIIIAFFVLRYAIRRYNRAVVRRSHRRR